MRPYSLLAEYYHHHWERYAMDFPGLIQWARNRYLEHVDDILLADLGCGAGALSWELARKGFQVVGCDISPEMIHRARQRGVDTPMPGLRGAHSPFAAPRFFEADMTSADFSCSVDMAVIAYDALNYLEGEHQVIECFANIKRQMKPGGILLFDSNTPRIYWQYQGVYERFPVPGGVIIQHSRYRFWERKGITDFTFHIDGTTSVETHVQWVYAPRRLKAMVRRSGFTVLHCFDDFNRRPMSMFSQKPIIVARAPE